MSAICTLLTLFWYALLAWIILSYVAGYGRLPWGHPVRKAYDFLGRIMDPLLRPIRSVLPTVRIGGMGLDLSPLVLFIVVRVLMGVLGC